MSICIHENCDQTTVELRAEQPKGALPISQLYCKIHLEEASIAPSDEDTSTNLFAATGE